MAKSDRRYCCSASRAETRRVTSIVRASAPFQAATEREDFSRGTVPSRGALMADPFQSEQRSAALCRPARGRSPVSMLSLIRASMLWHIAQCRRRERNLTRASRRLLALGSGGDTGVPARLTFRASLAALLWLLRELDPRRRRGRLTRLAGPRCVIGSKSRHAEQRHDQSQQSHGFPQSVEVAMMLPPWRA
jgi:hypothetical protein